MTPNCRDTFVLLLLRHLDDDDLLVQLDVFEEQRLEDEEDLSTPEGINLTSHLDVFHALFKKVRQDARGGGEGGSTPISLRLVCAHLVPRAFSFSKGKALGTRLGVCYKCS